MATDTPTLPCAACGHQNEPERVYCHNCGQKLDRSLLPKGQETVEESDEKRRRRVRKMMRPKRPIGATVKTLVSVLVFAGLIAAVFLYFQQPEILPDRKAIADRNAGDLWQSLMANPKALSLDLTEEEVNYFLKNTLKPADSSVPGVKFERAFVVFGNGTITVTVERTAWGNLPMYSSTTYAPRNSADGVTFEPIGVRFGRLGADPRIPSAPGLGLGGVQKALENEIKQFGRLAYVEPREVIVQVDGQPERRGTVKIVTKPAAP
jgi:hypothetical protein